MYFVSKKLKKKHNITDERAALYEAAETWVDALKGRQFLGLFNWYHDMVKLQNMVFVRTINFGISLLKQVG